MIGPVSRILAFALMASPAFADPVLVNSDNFIRAESDLYFAGIIANGELGKLVHTRQMAPLDNQTIIGLNAIRFILRVFSIWTQGRSRSRCPGWTDVSSRCR